MRGGGPLMTAFGGGAGHEISVLAAEPFFGTNKRSSAALRKTILPTI